jgi:hypothetical protein
LGGEKYLMGEFAIIEGYMALRGLFYKEICNAFCDLDKNKSL